MWNAKFFPDARLNYAENMLVKNDDTPALIFRGEDKVRRSMSWRKLNDRGRAACIRRFRQGRHSSRATASAPSFPICRRRSSPFLPSPRSAAVWSSCSPDFGERGILDRFGQIAPRFLDRLRWLLLQRQDHSDLRDKIAAVLQGIAERRGGHHHRLSRRRATDISRTMPQRRRLRGLHLARQSWSRSNSRSCPSIIRSIFSIPRARPAFPNASSIAPAASCSSI